MRGPTVLNVSWQMSPDRKGTSDLHTPLPTLWLVGSRILGTHLLQLHPVSMPTVDVRRVHHYQGPNVCTTRRSKVPSDNKLAINGYIVQDPSLGMKRVLRPSYLPVGRTSTSAVSGSVTTVTGTCVSRHRLVTHFSEGMTDFPKWVGCDHSSETYNRTFPS